MERSTASLRLFGDALQPAEVTRLLGCQPTIADAKGTVIRSSSGREYTVKSGRWLLKATPAQPEDLNGQIAWLLARLPQDLGLWRQLHSKYEVDLFCGLFMGSGNDGFSLSPEILLALGQRGLELHFDIYDPVDEED